MSSLAPRLYQRRLCCSLIGPVVIDSTKDMVVIEDFRIIVLESISSSCSHLHPLARRAGTHCHRGAESMRLHPVPLCGKFKSVTSPVVDV